MTSSNVVARRRSAGCPNAGAGPSELGRHVARHFHPDANLDDLRGAPGHDFLLQGGWRGKTLPRRQQGSLCKFGILEGRWMISRKRSPNGSATSSRLLGHLPDLRNPTLI